MTGRDKIQAAFSKEGASEIPVVICYEGIYIRDHWKQLTSCPWWYAIETDIGRQLMWRAEVMSNIGQDWFSLPSGHTKVERKNIFIQERPEGVFHLDRSTGNEIKLREPKVGGEDYHAWDNPESPATPEEIDRLLSPDPWLGNPGLKPEDIPTDGRKDLADRMLNGPFAGLCPYAYIASPLESCAWLWGFNGFMTKFCDEPELIKHACERFTGLAERGVAEAKALGAEAIWLEECYVDMISPDMYREFNAPYITRVVEAIRSAGMKSVYYHCGDPRLKLEQIIIVGADAISFEESKKGFTINIEDIVDAVHGRCTVLGNLDATTFLPTCAEDELKAEILRQIKAGRKNNGRFIMSMGSPVTPATPAEKVRLYCDLVREMGS